MSSLDRYRELMISNATAEELATFYREAEQRARETSNSEEVAFFGAQIAETHLQGGRHDEARRKYQEIWRERDCPVFVGLSLLKIVLRTGDMASAEHLVQEIRARLAEETGEPRKHGLIAVETLSTLIAEGLYFLAAGKSDQLEGTCRAIESFDSSGLFPVVFDEEFVRRLREAGKVNLAERMASAGRKIEESFARVLDQRT